MHLKPVTMILAVSLLALSPALPLFDLGDGGAAYAKGDKGGGADKGGSGDKGGGDKAGGKSEAKATKSVKATVVAKTPKKADPTAEVTVAKTKKVDAEGLAPNELGKMNGAMHANINAVLAHIRNGQTTNGPVGLLAGLAIADSGAAAAETAAADLEALADSFDELETTIADSAYGSVEEYLQAKADGTATEEEMATFDPLIDAVGGVDDTGLALADTAPTEEDIAAAEDAAAAAAEAVAGAEQAIDDAWNKDGDLQALLDALRERLVPHQAEIDAAIAEPTDDLAEAPTEAAEPVLE